MNAIKIKESCKKYENIVEEYFSKDEKKLQDTVNKILFKLRFRVDKCEFYSLAHEVFIDAICRYDGNSNFHAFLYTCLTNKFKTEMTKMNRLKRKSDKDAISIYTQINEDENFTLEDILPDNATVESIVFEDNSELYSKKMTEYLNKLSKVQRTVLKLLSIGYSQAEIMEELHITTNIYNDCIIAIRSYRNITILL